MQQRTSDASSLYISHLSNPDYIQIHFFCILNHFGASDDCFDVDAKDDCDDVWSDWRRLVDTFGVSIFALLTTLASELSALAAVIRTTPELIKIFYQRLTKICWHLVCSPIHPKLLGQSRFKPCRRPGSSCWVVRLHDAGLHAFGWGEGPYALGTTVKAIREGVGL